MTLDSYILIWLNPVVDVEPIDHMGDVVVGVGWISRKCGSPNHKGASNLPVGVESSSPVFYLQIGERLLDHQIPQLNLINLVGGKLGAHLQVYSRCSFRPRNIGNDGVPSMIGILMKILVE